MRKTFVVLLVLGSLVFAEGRVSARRIHANQLQLGEHRLTGLVRDRLAELSFEQEFHSTGGAPAEVFYEFALPVEATVTSLDMTMNGQWVTGRVLDRKEAKRTYESIVNRRKDPGLLERIGEGRYRVRVFPLPAKGNLKIRVHFQLLLPFRSGAVQLAYADPVGKASRFTGDVRIESPRTITRLDAPTHAVEVDRPSETAARVVWNDTKPRIELRYADQRDDVTFTLFSSRRAGERGTFLAILQPPVTVAEDEVLPKDVVFVLDESGSMEGDKMREAKRALHAGIDKLRDGDRFNVVGFSSGTEAFRDQLVEVNAATRKAARDWVSRRRAMGGTALDAALHDALRFGSRARLGLVALLTDGLPTVGESDPQRIVQRVRAANGARHRVFVFGVGLDQNARFLDALATSTRAVREDITKAAEVLPAMQRFYTRVERPLMTDLQLETPKGTAALQPHALPDLFAGDEVVVTGRFDQSGPALFKLRGRIGSRQVEHVFEGTLTKDQEIACLPRFWARKQVDALLAAIAAGGDRRELVPAVRRLGQQYSIVTPYTAGLVVEEEAPRPRPDRPEEVEETPIETEEVDDHNEVDTDSDFEESAGDAGMRDSPFVGPSTNAAIGIGGGAGGAGSVFRSRALGKGPVLHSVQDALRWIASQQRVDGSWGSVEATARALLPYLGSGFTDRGSARDNPYARTVRMGIRYLMNRQTKEGRFHKDDRVHALAAAVMAESYALTRNPRYKKPAQRALNALSLARAQYGAWPRDKADDRTTVVAVLALKAGKAAGLAIDPDSFEGARQHLRKSKRIDALWAREMLGELGAVKAGLKNLTLIVDKADSWDDVGVFLVGGEHWVNWRRARMEHLRKVQRRDGSWGGDVSKTADACLSLLTAQRYRPR